MTRTLPYSGKDGMDHIDHRLVSTQSCESGNNCRQLASSSPALPTTHLNHPPLSILFLKLIDLMSTTSFSHKPLRSILKVKKADSQLTDLDIPSDEIGPHRMWRPSSRISKGSDKRPTLPTRQVSYSEHSVPELRSKLIYDHES